MPRLLNSFFSWPLILHFEDKGKLVSGVSRGTGAVANSDITKIKHDYDIILQRTTYVRGEISRSLLCSRAILHH
jgi:hypothetical protein